MKKTLLASLALALALPLSAQPGPPPGGPGGPGPGGPPPDAVLKEALGFTDAQLQQLHQLLETRGQAMQALQTQIRDAEKALGDALEATNPDAATVGAKAIALHNLQKQGKTIDDAFKSGFEGILTSDQKTKVQALEALDASMKALGALHAIGY